MLYGDGDEVDLVLIEGESDGDDSTINFGDIVISPTVLAEVILYEADGPTVFSGVSGTLPDGLVVVVVTNGELPVEPGAYPARVILDPFLPDNQHEVFDLMLELDEETPDECDDEECLCHELD